jgi:hypothetical protein
MAARHGRAAGHRPGKRRALRGIHLELELDFLHDGMMSNPPPEFDESAPS